LGLYNGFIRKYLIPYLKERQVAEIKGITREVYTGLKIYLGEKGLVPKTINNRLTGLIRILKNHLRNELIDRLPYIQGEAYLTVERNPRIPLPKRYTEHLKGIIDMPIYYNFLTKEPPEHDTPPFIREPYLLSVLGLLCGMRNSETARLKPSDIKKAECVEGAYYYIKCLNEKTKHHHKTDGERYRKLPIHPFILGLLIDYININKIGEDDYLFGEPKIIDGKEDGVMNPKRHAKAMFEFYCQLKAKATTESTGNIAMLGEAEFHRNAIVNEMKEERQSFYSLRHTFETIFEMKHKGDTILNDYFMGHKPQGMLGNYLHINGVGDSMFWDDYGKHMIEFQKWFIHKHDEESSKRRLEYVEGLIDNGVFDDVEVFGNPSESAKVGALFISEAVRLGLQKKRKEANTPKMPDDKVSRFFGGA